MLIGRNHRDYFPTETTPGLWFVETNLFCVCTVNHPFFYLAYTIMGSCKEPETIRNHAWLTNNNRKLSWIIRCENSLGKNATNQHLYHILGCSGCEQCMASSWRPPNHKHWSVYTPSFQTIILLTASFLLYENFVSVKNWKDMKRCFSWKIKIVLKLFCMFSITENSSLLLAKIILRWSEKERRHCPFSQDPCFLSSC